MGSANVPAVARAPPRPRAEPTAGAVRRTTAPPGVRGVARAALYDHLSARGHEVGEDHVRTADVLDGDLTRVDVKTGSLGARDIANSAFRSGDVTAMTSLGGIKQFGLAENAVESAEIQNGAVRYEDLAKSARPTAFAAADDDTARSATPVAPRDR
jgi:hypothetical protein